MIVTDPALLSAEELANLYATRALPPVEALQAVTLRIARLNPGLNAFMAMNTHAMVVAGKSATRWVAGWPLGSPAGVPSTVRGLVDVASLPTRQGNWASDPLPVIQDAPAMVGLKAPRAAGPIVQTVRDSALVLSAIARHDLRDPHLPARRSARLPGRDHRRGGGATRGDSGAPGVRSAGGYKEHRGDGAGGGVAGRGRSLCRGSQFGFARYKANFPRGWSVALARLVKTFLAEKRAVLNPGLLAVAAPDGDVSSMELLDADALRLQAGRASDGAISSALRSGVLPHRAEPADASRCAAD